MIYVIDDRQQRQSTYLGSVKQRPPAFIKIFSNKEVDTFKESLRKEEDLASISEANIVCVHSTSLFELGNPNAKTFFEQWCKNEKIPIIYFSGGNSLVSTIKPKAIYTSNVKDFYKRIRELHNEEIDFKDPNQVLFGEKYLLNQLLSLRRKLYVFKSLGIRDQLLDEASSNNHPVIRSIFSKWEKVYRDDDPKVWEEIINQEINKISE